MDEVNAEPPSQDQMGALKSGKVVGVRRGWGLKLCSVLFCLLVFGTGMMSPDLGAGIGARMGKGSVYNNYM